MLFTRRGVVRTAAAMAPAVWFGAREAMADSDASQISRDATAALRRLDATDHRAVTLGQKAAGILVFPKIVKAGFIFGGQGGKGVLTEHGQPTAITRCRSVVRPAGRCGMVQLRPVLHGSTGAPVSRQERWMGGRSDPNVRHRKGAGASFDSTTLSHKVVAIPFGQNGLMAGLALQGSKITTYNPNA